MIGSIITAGDEFAAYRVFLAAGFMPEDCWRRDTAQNDYIWREAERAAGAPVVAIGNYYVVAFNGVYALPLLGPFRNDLETPTLCIDECRRMARELLKNSEKYTYGIDREPLRQKTPGRFNATFDYLRVKWA